MGDSEPQFTIYCDKADDEMLARQVFSRGPLSRAHIVRLPHRSAAPECLQDFLRWERSDWLITRDDVLVAAAELSRHGYTGDNGFQRFARLQRAASLGVPGVYFTPFSRSRLNELDEGQNNPRNVAPEMFEALISAGEEYEVPCLAVRWPTDGTGTPWPLNEPEAQAAVSTLRTIMEGFATAGLEGNRGWSWPPEVDQAMSEQAAIARRTSEVRGTVRLPIDAESDEWLWENWPPEYFARGKADKVLAYMALASTNVRPSTNAPRGRPFWMRRGEAQVLFLGYQWRPDPSCGLIAFSGVLARRYDLPLIVVWPRVFLRDSSQRRRLVTALTEFELRGTGPILDASLNLAFDDEKIERFRRRINTTSNQFGVFTPQSKIGRVLSENADLCVFGDGLYYPR